jgi:hypothetical protein
MGIEAAADKGLGLAAGLAFFCFREGVQPPPICCQVWYLIHTQSTGSEGASKEIQD